MPPPPERRGGGDRRTGSRVGAGAPGGRSSIHRSGLCPASQCRTCRCNRGRSSSMPRREVAPRASASILRGVRRRRRVNHRHEPGNSPSSSAASAHALASSTARRSARTSRSNSYHDRLTDLETRRRSSLLCQRSPGARPEGVIPQGGERARMRLGRPSARRHVAARRGVASSVLRPADDRAVAIIVAEMPRRAGRDELAASPAVHRAGRHERCETLALASILGVVAALGRAGTRRTV